MVVKMFRKKIAKLEAQIKVLEQDKKDLERDIKELERLDELHNETVKWYQELRRQAASVSRINQDLISGRMQWQDKNTGEWKKFTDA